MIQNFIAFNFKNLALVLDNPGGDCKFSNTNMISAYHGESEKASLISGSPYLPDHLSRQ